jgi:cytochrome c biogenesis protein
MKGLWRKLRTMRTAIVLLLLLAAGASVGSFFPQRPISPVDVASYTARNPGWARVANGLGLFDVYGAWWFMGIYVLLLVSLVGCLLPRYRAFWRAVRARPRVTSMLDRQQQYTSGTVRVAPERALAGAERVLRARRFRSVRAEETIAAEKGHLREFGSLVFHTAFLVLLLGMSLGKLFGFSGQAAVVEGDTFTDVHVAYDTISEGRLFNEHHRGFSVKVNDFDVDWFPDGTPKRFLSRVTLSDGARVVRDADIQVNHPLTYRGVRVYQLSWGWAPVLRVTQNGRALSDGPVVFLPRGGGWHGVLKIPETVPQQTGFDMAFFTDPVLDAQGNARDASPRPIDPVIVFQRFLGDLRLDRPQSVYELDPTTLSPAEKGGLRVGDSVKLSNGVEIAFTGLKQYSVFEIASNPGAPILLLAAILILVGLIPALYSSRRRVWVRAMPSGEAARLEIAGHALQRKAAFTEEFRALVRDLDRDLATLTTEELEAARDG